MGIFDWSLLRRAGHFDGSVLACYFSLHFPHTSDRQLIGLFDTRIPKEIPLFWTNVGILDRSLLRCAGCFDAGRFDRTLYETKYVKKYRREIVKTKTFAIFDFSLALHTRSATHKSF